MKKLFILVLLIAVVTMGCESSMTSYETPSKQNESITTVKCDMCGWETTDIYQVGGNKYCKDCKGGN